MPQPKPHPQNVSGPFYVDDGCCLRCDVPKSVAPDMFKYTDDEQHCFVYRQPESAADLERMIEVLQFQDILCIRCRSRDRELLRKLRKHGITDEIFDLPEKA